MSQLLLQRVATGEVAAAQECIDRFGDLVWSLARRLLPRHVDSEDAVQEIFLDLWKSAARYDPQLASESTFVAMIARRRLIDRRRRLARQMDPAGSAPIDEVELPAVALPDRVEIQEEAARAVDALGALRPEQQRILRLSIYDGWSHQEIADHLQVPLGTVKTHVRRGLIRIRELLAERREREVS